MRQARLTMDGHHFVHSVTRIVDREFLMAELEREYLWQLIEVQSNFSGAQVVTAAILSNHAHLLLEQVDREAVPWLTAEDLFGERLPHIYHAAEIRSLRSQYDNLIKLGDPELIDAFLQSFANQRQGTAKLYRLWLYHEGQEILPDYTVGQHGRWGFSQRDLEAGEALGGQMPKTEVLRYRVRYFTDGAALGTAAFIEKIFQGNRANFG